MMKTTFKNTTLAVALFLGVMQSPVMASDFIENMPTLSADPERPEAMVWKKAGFDLSKYDRVMVEPVTIFIDPNSKYKGIKADELKTLSDGFHETLVTTLEPEVAVINEAGEGVLYVRAAIVDLRLEEKRRGLLSFTPVGMVANAMTDNFSLKDAKLEIEVYDSVSQERLGVLVNKSPKTEDESLSWDSIKSVFQFYAERFKSKVHKN